jgi:hypothetical protein
MIAHPLGPGRKNLCGDEILRRLDNSAALWYDTNALVRHRNTIIIRK